MSTQLRSKILAQADELISRDRNAQYGDAKESFERVAAIWTALKGVKFTADDVALFMVSLKLVRANDNSSHSDSIVDLIGYAALYAEFTISEE